MHAQLSATDKGSITAELWEAGVDMMEQSIRRRKATSTTQAAIQAELQDWLYRHDEASVGDVSGPIRVR
jgi:hypothetical protein